MVLLKRVFDEIESKKIGVSRGLLTLMLEWKSLEQHLDMTGTRLRECFIELESREKHMCSIQESIMESLKELELVRESLNAKCYEVEDKEREISGYVDDLKKREEKLNEKEMSIRGMLEVFENVIEGRLKEIGKKEERFYELACELDSREERLKQRENEMKAREEELGCDSRKRQRTTMLVGSNSPMKRLKEGKSSEYSIDVDTSNDELCYDRIVRDDSESESQTGITQVYDCPRAKFHDFDKEKNIENFDVDQIWACYDDLDGMPRLYARVEKVFTPKFKLQMVWLEANAEEDHELQVSCGRFRLGSSLDVTEHLIFSHQVQCQRDVQGYYLIYPMKGETWAVWSSEILENDHRQFKYEIVEVLSDFVDGVGVRVSYLDKVSGFMSIFERRRRGSDSFVIPANELHRFSHKVPSFKLTETRNESFELDPASLPHLSDNARCNDKVKVGNEEVDDVSKFRMDHPEET